MRLTETDTDKNHGNYISTYQFFSTENFYATKTTAGNLFFLHEKSLHISSLAAGLHQLES